MDRRGGWWLWLALTAFVFGVGGGIVGALLVQRSEPVALAPAPAPALVVGPPAASVESGPIVAAVARVNKSVVSVQRSISSLGGRLRFWENRSEREQRRAPPLISGMGSGVIISPDGYILTNQHVVEGADKITVRLWDGRELRAKLIGQDRLSDLALLKVQASNLSAARLGDSKALRPGEWVAAIGCPFGLEHSVTAGVVSAVGRPPMLVHDPNEPLVRDYTDLIQTDAAINQGNSGGPLINLAGEVVGINTLIYANSERMPVGIGFAIPAHLVRRILERMTLEGEVKWPALGVQIADAGEGASSGGVRVIRLISDKMPAAKAGVRPDDLITALDGTPVRSSDHLKELIRAHSPQDTVTLTIMRGKKQITLKSGLTAWGGELSE